MSQGNVTHEQGDGYLPRIEFELIEASTTIPSRIRLPDKSRGGLCANALYRSQAANPGLPAHLLGRRLFLKGDRPDERKSKRIVTSDEG